MTENVRAFLRMKEYKDDAKDTAKLKEAITTKKYSGRRFKSFGHDAFMPPNLIFLVSKTVRSECATRAIIAMDELATIR